MTYSDIDIDALKSAARAVVHAFCGDMNVDIYFSNTISRSVGSAIYLREPKLPMAKKDVLGWRAETDRAILKMVFYDAKIISSYAPENSTASEFYYALSRLYADLRGIHQYAGIALNLRFLFEEEILSYGPVLSHASLSEKWLCVIAYSFFPKIYAGNFHLELGNILEATPEQFKNYLSLLKDNFLNPEKFLSVAAKMAIYFFDEDPMNGQNDSSCGQPQDPTFNPSQDANLFGDSQNLALEEDVTVNQNGIIEDDQNNDDTVQKQSYSHNPDIDDMSAIDDDTTFEFPAEAFGSFDSSDFRRHDMDYKVFSTVHDKIVPADALCKLEEKKSLRKELDNASVQYQGMTSKIAARLQAKLFALQASLSTRHLTEGQIDSKKIASFIADPMQDDIFKIIDNNFMRDVSFTLLIDCSGSMRGRPMTIAAVSADMIASIFEKCGVNVEILGFTTAAWKGGNVKKEWEKVGCPPLPGRLNDLLHIIFKDAHVSRRKAHDDLGVLLKESLLKENIDGEALLWAHDRLMQTSSKRKILMVISDGAPVDDSTFSANDSGILERHLRNVIEKIEKKSPVELTAIGIGHDVTRYYNNAVTIRNIDKLAEVMMDQFITLFDCSKRKSFLRADNKK